jgi:hypothetical protein
MLGYCLTLDTPDDWTGFAVVAAARLTPKERAALAFAALASLDDDQAEATAAAVIRYMGAPLPAFLGGMDEARWWARGASRSELKAFAWATFEAMHPRDRSAFLSHVTARAAA